MSLKLVQCKLNQLDVKNKSKNDQFDHFVYFNLHTITLIQSNNNKFITVQLFLINSYIVVSSVDAWTLTPSKKY